jgi:hypothetical protein
VKTITAAVAVLLASIVMTACAKKESAAPVEAAPEATSAPAEAPPAEAAPAAVPADEEEGPHTSGDKVKPQN